MVVRLVLLCQLVALSRGSIIQPSCSAANDVLDYALNLSNTEMEESYSDTEPEDDFALELPVYFLGIRLPWTVSFSVSDGSMKPFACLSRSGDADAVQCSTSIMKTLEAQLKYDNIVFSYKNMKAKFLFFEMEGSLLYNVGPVKFDVAVAKGTTLGPPQGPTCSIEAFQFVSTGTKEVEITSDSRVKWLFKKLIQSSLLDEKIVPVLGELQQTATWNLYTFFGQDWCENIWKNDM